jgi:hypothetical protein
MIAIQSRTKPVERGTILSSLWIFAMFNYLYADVMSLMDPSLRDVYASGIVQGSAMRITPAFLLYAAILMETAMLMVVLPRILRRGASRLANIVFGIIHTLAVAGSLFVGSSPAPYYILCASFEIPTTILIIILAATWKKETADE